MPDITHRPSDFVEAVFGTASMYVMFDNYTRVPADVPPRPDSYIRYSLSISTNALVVMQPLLNFLSTTAEYNCGNDIWIRFSPTNNPVWNAAGYYTVTLSPISYLISRFEI